MGIFSFLKRKKRDYGDYRKSRHAHVYEQIATRLNNSPQHVYEIAHGKPLRNHDDRVVLQALLVSRIVG